MSELERTPAQWFDDAERCYVEGHQACAWCGGAHQVHRVESPRGVEFHCNRCDFHAGYDRDLDRYAIIPGEENARLTAPLTMFEF
jgi:hypothetical protein